MTWIRLECDIGDHPVIGRLATALRVDHDKAFALYVRTLAKFGDHQPDGDPSSVADGTLEDWAKWKGRVGVFAAAFRALCLELRSGERDPAGAVKGWWRQDALLRKQRVDRDRRPVPEIPQENSEKPPRNPRGFSGENRGNGNGNETTHQPSARDPAGIAGTYPAEIAGVRARLAESVPDGPDRQAVLGFIAALPVPDQPAWASRLTGYLGGLDFPAGMCPTPGQLATACRDYSGTPNPIHFRAFVLRILKQPPNGKSRRSSATGQEALEAAADWARRRQGVAGA